MALCQSLIIYIIFGLGYYITSQIYDHDNSEAAMTLLTGVYVNGEPQFNKTK
jgi:hypothetical protein